MRETLHDVMKQLKSSNLKFSCKPILIGGKAMEYYDIRKSGEDIDLVVSDADYQALAEQYPEKRKDLYGDLGMVIDEFEIWRSIAHLDYDFFKKDAIEEGDILVISIDRLLWTRVCAMEVDKYKNDLLLIREYYYKKYTNQKFHEEALQHEQSYRELNGAVFAGQYVD